MKADEQMYKKERVLRYPEYMVDTDGVVYGKYGKRLHPHNSIYGYPTVTLFVNKKCVVIAVHTLVAEQFVKRENEKALWVQHKDGNKTNNKASNLAWVTCSEAMKKAVQNNNYNVAKRKPVHLWKDKEDYTFESLCAAERFLTEHLGFQCHRGNICSAIQKANTAYGYYCEYL